jgi:hypothetical protein
MDAFRQIQSFMARFRRTAPAGYEWRYIILIKGKPQRTPRGRISGLLIRRLGGMIAFKKADADSRRAARTAFGFRGAKQHRRDSLPAKRWQHVRGVDISLFPRKGFRYPVRDQENSGDPAERRRQRAVTAALLIALPPASDETAPSF